MKEHLVNLLIEEYKQQCLFKELENKGVGLMDICVNNLDIVLDIIGFPKDNTLEYDYDHLNSGETLRDETKKIMDDDHFCRDWLKGKHFETFNTLATQQKVCVTKTGLQVESGADKETVKKLHLDYVGWLYSEYEKWKNGEYDQ